MFNDCIGVCTVRNLSPLQTALRCCCVCSAGACDRSLRPLPRPWRRVIVVSTRPQPPGARLRVRLLSARRTGERPEAEGLQFAGAPLRPQTQLPALRPVPARSRPLRPVRLGNPFPVPSSRTVSVQGSRSVGGSLNTQTWLTPLSSRPRVSGGTPSLVPPSFRGCRGAPPPRPLGASKVLSSWFSSGSAVCVGRAEGQAGGTDCLVGVLAVRRGVCRSFGSILSMCLSVFLPSALSFSLLVFQ